MTSQPRRLAARRVELGLTQEALAELVGASPASVRRWEAGTSEPRAGQRQPLAKALQMTLPELEQALNGQTGAAAPNPPATPGWLSRHASLEAAATRVQTLDPVAMPDLLQTRAYATAAIERHYWIEQEDIAGRVRARLARQAALDRDPVPLELICLIDESVLHREVGDAGIMADQLDHLVAMAERPSVLIQVIPAAGPGLLNASFGAFTLFTSTESTEPYLLCTEDLGGIHYQDGPLVVDAHAELFEHLYTTALPPERSVELIRAGADRYRRLTGHRR